MIDDDFDETELEGLTMEELLAMYFAITLREDDAPTRH